MLYQNPHSHFGEPIEPADAATLDAAAADDVHSYLAQLPDYRSTELYVLSTLAREYGVRAIYLKDESSRLGLGSFKALGGAYAVIRLVLEEASRQLCRRFDYSAIKSPEVRAVAQTMTVACATDGNHGRSVAMGAQLVGANCSIFVHSGVSAERVAAIRSFGAETICVDGTYDDSVEEAAQVSQACGWVTVSDTSWLGYERVPGLVMQGYTAMVREALEALPERPTHVFIQAGVGGLAAAVAGHFALVYGKDRPTFIVVEPDRAACLYETARAGHPVRLARGEPTVMAMLECYHPSLVAWRILCRVADAFMTVADEDAVAVMNRLARPLGSDRPVVAGESGGVGLAGLAKVAGDASARKLIGLDARSSVFLINTEGATDPKLYQKLTGLRPEAVLRRGRRHDHFT